MFWYYENSQSKFVEGARVISSCDVTFIFVFVLIASGRTLLHLEEKIPNFSQNYGCGIP